MRSTVLLAATLSFAGAAVAFGQTPAPRQGPGVQAAQDAREPAVLAQCKQHHPAPPPNFGNFRPPAGGNGPAKYQVTAIPGVVAAGQKWKVVWRDKGNDADGIIGTPDEGLLVAQNDNSDVVKLDKGGHPSIVYQDTDTGGALSMNKQGELFIDERGLNAAIWELAPQHKVIINSIEGDSLDCLGGVLNDLTASNNGIYFSQGGLYYAAPNGKVTQQGDKSLRTNGIILSPDEKTLYVTNAGTLVAFDVQSDGSLTNQHVLATLPGGGGDGSTVDADGRIYVSAAKGVVVISPQGQVLGTIPVPHGVISLAFSGPDKKTLYAVATLRSSKPGVRGIASGEVITMRMISQGYDGRAK